MRRLVIRIVLALLSLIGLAQQVRADTHHGPYPYLGVNVVSYDDPVSALHNCQNYMDQEQPNFSCHNFSMEYDPGNPQHAEAAGMCGGGNPVAAWHFNSGTSAGRRYFWGCNYGTSGSCPTGMDPGAGEDGACGSTQQCPVGDTQRFHATAGEPIPQNVCSNGCWYERDDDDMPLTFVMAGQSWSGNFTSTGNACEAGGGPGGPPDNPPTNCVSDNYGNTFCAGVGPDNAPPNCMEDGTGNQACIDAYDPQNCGYINGQQVCYDDYPDNAECHFIPGGSYLCFPGDEEPQSPPYPDTGTPGEPATPDVQMQRGDGQGGQGPPIDYFDTDTVNQSSGEGGAPGPESDMSTPDQVELDGPIEVELKDDVQIDETGTPSGPSANGYDSLLDTTGIGQLQADIDAIGSGSLNPIPEMPTSFTDLEDLIPTSGSCNDPTINFFGHTMTIPLVSKGGPYRDIMGWFFYAITGIFLFYTLVGLPRKVR